MANNSQKLHYQIQSFHLMFFYFLVNNNFSKRFFFIFVEKKKTQLQKNLEELGNGNQFATQKITFQHPLNEEVHIAIETQMNQKCLGGIVRVVCCNGFGGRHIVLLHSLYTYYDKKINFFVYFSEV